ncbi:MAG: CRISPR-associated RAMP protein Csx7 [Acidobacteriota bacterium]
MMFHQFTSRLTLKGELETLTAIRIGASKSTSPTEPDLPVVKDALGYPYIPGSSFKGVLRSHTEAMLRGILGEDVSLVCNPTNNDEWCIPAGRGKQGRKGIEQLKENNKTDAQYTEKILSVSCLICQLFGSPWLASRLQVRDLLVVEKTWFGQFQERNGVAIDRGKEVAAEGKLYDFEVVPAGTRFTFTALVENAEAWQLGMLMAGLRPFQTGDIAIGGARSRGLGLVKLRLNDEEQSYIDSEDKDALLDAIIGDSSSNDDGISPERIEEWRSAFREKVRSALKKKEEGSHA